MVRILVIADDSLLADGIVSILAKEMDMEVIRLTQREPGTGHREICKDGSAVIIFEEGASDHELIAASQRFHEHGPLLVITISPESHHLHICESYQIPNPGKADLVSLVRDFGKLEQER